MRSRDWPHVQTNFAKQMTFTIKTNQKVFLEEEIYIKLLAAAEERADRYNKMWAAREQEGKTIYFGDHCQPGGNDFTAAQASDKFHHIEHGYKETWKILKKEYKTG